MMNRLQRKRLFKDLVLRSCILESLPEQAQLNLLNSRHHLQSFRRGALARAPHTPASKLSLRLLPAVLVDDDDDDGNFTKWMSSYWGHGGGDKRATERKRSFRRSRQSMYDRRASLPCTSQLEVVRLKHLSTPSHLQRREEEGELLSHPHARRASSDEYRGRKAGGKESGISSVPELTESFMRMLHLRKHRVPTLNDPDNESLICHEEKHRRHGDTGRGGQEHHCSHQFQKEARRMEQAARSRSWSSAAVCESRKEVPLCSKQKEYRLFRHRWSIR